MNTTNRTELKRKKITMREHVFWLGGIFLFSVLFFMLLLAGHKNVFYADDNAIQWGPIIRPAFDSIFAGHGIPYWDFYQYKGLDIFSSGYYGLTNPFMYISYMISRFLFHFSVDILCVYEWLLYWLGLSCMYLVLCDLKLRRSTVAVSLLAYATPLIFFLYSFYYFEFNCYFMMPLLIWTLFRVHKKKTEWFIPGLLLGFSMFLGHVQYTCYFVMVFCIILTVLAVSEKSWANLLKVVTNIAIFVTLSSSFLVLSLQVSKNRDVILAAYPEDGFFAYDIHMRFYANVLSRMFLQKGTIDRGDYQVNIGMGIFAFLPIAFLLPAFKDAYAFILNKLKSSKGKGSSKNASPLLSLAGIVLIFLSLILCSVTLSYYVPGLTRFFLPLLILSLVCGVVLLLINKSRQRSFQLSDSFARTFFMLLMISLCFLIYPLLLYICAILYYLARRFREKEETLPVSVKWMHAFLFAAFFFVFFAAGKAAGLAELLYKIPVFCSFRHLYKCAFIYIPLLIITGAYALDRIKPRKWLGILSVGFSILYVFNIVFMIHSGQHRYINNPVFSYVKRDTIEPEVRERMQRLGIDTNYRIVTLGDETLYDQEEDYNGIEYSSYICEYAFTKNLATKYGVFSIGGYDNIFSIEGFKATNLIMFHMYLEGMFDNMIAYPKDFGDVLIEREDAIGRFETQWKEAGIRYLLVPHDGPNANNYLRIFDHCDNLHIVNRSTWLYGYDLVEIEGTNPICCYGDAKCLPIDARIDCLKFQTNFSESTEITISMTYEPEYRLALKEKSTGKITYATLEKNDIGYMTAQIPAGDYTVELTYENTLMDLTMVISVVTTLLTLGAVLFLCKKGNKEIVPEGQVSETIGL